MAATRNPKVRLAHIRDELSWLLPEFAKLSYKEFQSDLVRIRAAERALLIISEAAKSLPDQLLQRYPEIEWHAVRAIGNVIRHEYERVEPRLLWRTIRESLPRLASVVEKMIAEIPE
jgi:uncharacterized protein with HEPN domain